MLASIYKRRNIRSLWRQIWDFFLVGSAFGADIVVEGGCCWDQCDRVDISCDGDWNAK
jgi:hypothetical protein